MFRFKLHGALVALTAIAAFALPASALATNVTTWKIQQQNIDPNNDQAPDARVPTILFDPYLYSSIQVPAPDNPGCDDIEPGTPDPNNPNCWDYFTNGPEALIDSNETWGISLDWRLKYPSEWEFIRQPGTYVTQQIAADERVALFNTQSGHYLAEGHEKYGTNLVWSQTPQYQWQVAKGGDRNNPFYADLYNTTEKAYLIYHQKTLGVDLGWIHAPFYTGPDYLPPKLPVSTTARPGSGSPLPVK